jgi:hypothetical protein
VDRNTSNNNADVGFALFVSTNNGLAGNTSLNNGDVDAFQDGGSTGNAWVNNTFGTTFGI